VSWQGSCADHPITVLDLRDRRLSATESGHLAGGADVVAVDQGSH
jgi:hypothetical protein